MSIESARSFMKALAEDPQLRTSLENAPDDGVRREIIAAAGYSFNPEELQSVVDEQVQSLNSAPEALDEDALEAVAGGTSAVTDGDCTRQFFNYNQSSSV